MKAIEIVLCAFALLGIADVLIGGRFGIGIGFLQKFTDVVVIKNIVSIDDAFAAVCYIAMILAGIFPLLDRSIAK